jgi:hypothetical protein
MLPEQPVTPAPLSGSGSAWSGFWKEVKRLATLLDERRATERSDAPAILNAEPRPAQNTEPATGKEATA